VDLHPCYTESCITGIRLYISLLCWQTSGISSTYAQERAREKYENVFVCVCVYMCVCVCVYVCMQCMYVCIRVCVCVCVLRILRKYPEDKFFSTDSVKGT
jgi:hypothetical protein